MTDRPRRVLVTDFAWPDLDIERAVLGEVAELVVAQRGDEDELTELAGDVSAIMTNWKRVPAGVLDAAPACVTVARYGVGTDNIDVARASELGILVTRVPDYCIEEVADHTLALLLACARRVVAFDRAVRRSVWDNKGSGALARLRGQTIGILGFGNIGQAVAARARAFGLEPLVVARSSRDVAGITVTTDIDAVVSQADYLSLHLPLTDETRHILDERRLRSMKPTAYLINTARGALVDEDALSAVLADGAIAGAALDVLTSEPPAWTTPLRALDNTVLTPHAGFYSAASIAELARRTAENVLAVLEGGLPQSTYIWNGEIVGHSVERRTRQTAT